MCGARLAAPVPDGTAATTPGGSPPTITSVPDLPSDENVVYLTEERGIQPGPPRGAVPPNRRAHDYDGVEPPGPQPQPAGPIPLHPRVAPPDIDALRARVAAVEGALPPFASHGPLPSPEELQPPERVQDNPFGDFFADGPSAWLEDDDTEDQVPIDRPRLLGTLVALLAILMASAAWGVWGLAMYRGAGGAEAGGFVLLSMLLWVWYLSMPRRRQHAFLLRRHEQVRRLVDRRVVPLRERTEGQLAMRRERDRYRAMRDERTRRVSALGEGAYRAFRQGALPEDLLPGAQRVMAIERQMLVQDQRIRAMERDRAPGKGPSDGQSGADPAGPAPGGGQGTP